MIIDCHVHLNRYKEQQEATLSDRIRVFESAMRQNRIDTAIVLSSYVANDNRPSALELVEAFRDKPYLKVVAGISINYTDEGLEALRGAIQDKHIVGLKIYPGYEPFYPHDPKMHRVYEFAAEYELPVMIHTGDTYAPNGKVKFAQPIHVDEIAVDHRKVNFVICHLGNPWFEDTMEIIYKNPNVYADISGLVLGNFSDRFEKYLSQKVQEFVQFGVDPSKMLYGTDWPIAEMHSYLKFVEDLRMPMHEKNQLLHENSAKLFKISEEHSLIQRGRR